ncbi:hypothetical protein [Hamadaea tsunoensis]|uniref:hypothetical protein n=1 Tax=Hamadaea tsunoensis TaxID=53368 RepID=UPI0012F7ED85|nr:hypothetical protein [Hamadaea tsunoensis]
MPMRPAARPAAPKSRIWIPVTIAGVVMALAVVFGCGAGLIAWSHRGTGAQPIGLPGDYPPMPTESSLPLQPSPSPHMIVGDRLILPDRLVGRPKAPATYAAAAHTELTWAATMLPKGVPSVSGAYGDEANDNVVEVVVFGVAMPDATAWVTSVERHYSGPQYADTWQRALSSPVSANRLPMYARCGIREEDGSGVCVWADTKMCGVLLFPLSGQPYTTEPILHRDAIEDANAV